MKKISKVKFTKKIIFPDFLKAIKKGDKKRLLQAKKQKYKINMYWLIENDKKVKPAIKNWLVKNKMLSKSTKNLSKLMKTLTLGK